MSLVYIDLKNRGPRNKVFKRNQPWYWVAISGDNFKRLARSTESYTNREDAISAATLLFGTGSNVYLREAEHGNVTLRLATTGEQANKNRIQSFQKPADS